MNTQLLITFIILNAFNVIIQTAKSILTISGNKFVAALANAIAYGLYTIVVVYMVCELPLWWKVGIIALCNFIGVFIVKFIEEKSRKDRLWKIEATVNSADRHTIDKNLREIPHSYIRISDKHTLFNFYCANKTQSEAVRMKLSEYNAKFFVTESKIHF